MKELGFEEVKNQELLISGGLIILGPIPRDYFSLVMEAIKFVKEYGDDFIAGFKEGWNSFDYKYKYRD